VGKHPGMLVACSTMPFERNETHEPWPKMKQTVHARVSDSHSITPF